MLFDKEGWGECVLRDDALTSFSEDVPCRDVVPCVDTVCDTVDFHSGDEVSEAVLDGLGDTEGDPEGWGEFELDWVSKATNGEKEGSMGLLEALFD